MDHDERHDDDREHPDATELAWLEADRQAWWALPVEERARQIREVADDYGHLL